MTDVLSDALSTVRMNAAIFFDASFTAPWGFKAPRSGGIRVGSRARRRQYRDLSPAHGRSCGRAHGRYAEMPLEAGDIVMVPHGDAYSMSTATRRNGATAPIRSSDTGRAISAPFMPAAAANVRPSSADVSAPSGRRCGCFLAGLPRMIKINIRGDASGVWLESSIRHLVSESASGRPGSVVLLSKMAEALFVESRVATWSSCGGADRLARRRPRRAGWRRAGADTQAAVPSVDAARSGGGDRNVADRAVRAVRALPRRVADELSVALALAAGRPAAAGGPQDYAAGWRWTSATSRRQRSTARSSVSSGCRRRSIARQ